MSNFFMAHLIFFLFLLINKNVFHFKLLLFLFNLLSLLSTSLFWEEIWIHWRSKVKWIISLMSCLVLNNFRLSLFFANRMLLFTAIQVYVCAKKYITDYTVKWALRKSAVVLIVAQNNIINLSSFYSRSGYELNAMKILMRMKM